MSNRPKREDFPLTEPGDTQFNNALMTWQYEEIERLNRYINILESQMDRETLKWCIERREAVQVNER